MATARELSTATQARLQTLPALITVYPGSVPKTPAGLYVAYYPDAPRGSSDRASWAPTVLAWGCYLVCVGRDVDGCLEVADQVRSVLAFFYPDISESAEPLKEVDLENSVQPDQDVPGDVRYALTLRYALITNTTRS